MFWCIRQQAGACFFETRQKHFYDIMLYSNIILKFSNCFLTNVVLYLSGMRHQAHKRPVLKPVLTPKRIIYKI